MRFLYNKSNRLKYLIIVCCLISSKLLAQTSNADIKVLGAAMKDSVVLRWAPDKPVAWQLGIKNGYLIDRYTVWKDGKRDTSNMQPVRLTPSPIMPLPLDDWEPLVKNDKYAAIAAQAIYGDDFELDDPAGDQASFLNQASELENRFGFALMSADLSATVARAMGLRYVDNDITPGERYVYKIYLASNATSSYRVDTGSYYIDPADVLQLPPPTELAIQVGDQSVGLSWESYYHDKIYVSYVIERSEDEGRTYNKREEVPFLNISKNTNPRRTYYLDSLSENNKVYFYRVKGLTPFGSVGPPSEPIKGVGLASAKGVIAQIDSTGISFDGQVDIKWSFPDAFKDKIMGFKVARGATAKGPYITISKNMLSATTYQFKDVSPKPINYYVIKAIGRDSVETTSFPVLVQPEDSIPPLPPSGLTGGINTSGIVSIQWDANEEADVSGYRVFRANSPMEEFIQITKGEVLSLSYKDSINIATLSENIYYKLIAEDNHGNPSEYSTILNLEKPDIIPPSPPVFQKISVDGSSVRLSWANSPSDDVLRYSLKRVFNGDSTLVKIFPKNTNTRSYTDANLPTGTYRYFLMAHDDDSLFSDLAFISIAVTDGINKAIIENIKSQVDRDKREIKLSWSNLSEIKRVIIYRKKDEEPLRLYKSTNGSSFIDKNPAINSRYIYRLKGVLANGLETELSEPITVAY